MVFVSPDEVHLITPDTETDGFREFWKINVRRKKIQKIY